MALSSITGAASPYYNKLTFACLVPVAVLYSLTVQLIRWPLCWLVGTSFNVRALPSSCAIEQQQHRQGNNNNKKKKLLAIVTGSNTGIGYETARCLAINYGMHVVLACRNATAAQDAAARLRAAGGTIDVQLVDLAYRTSIQTFAATIRQTYGKIHVLVNNAGRNSTSVTTPVDINNNNKVDLLFQTNFLGPYELTTLLLDHMADGGRIVNLSSVMHHFCGSVDVTKGATWKKAAQGQLGETYALTKLAALLLTVELNHRHGGKIRSIAVNPGAVNSDIWRNFPSFVRSIFSLFYLNNRQGCATSVAACVMKEEENDDEKDTLPLYLQPYNVPSFLMNAQPLFPLWEMLGPYVGYQATMPRLPSNAWAAASALCSTCDDLLLLSPTPPPPTTNNNNHPAEETFATDSIKDKVS